VSAPVGGRAMHNGESDSSGAFCSMAGTLCRVGDVGTAAKQQCSVMLVCQTSVVCCAPHNCQCFVMLVCQTSVVCCAPHNCQFWGNSVKASRSDIHFGCVCKSQMTMYVSTT